MLQTFLFVQILSWVSWSFSLSLWIHYFESKVHIYTTLVAKRYRQESPPAWTQEPYRPRRIKYSICFPKWGYPNSPPPAGGTPRPGLTGGYLRWGTPPGRGYPPTRSDSGAPEVRYPPPPQVWTDKQSETITSRLILRTRSVMKKCESLICYHIGR